MQTESLACVRRLYLKKLQMLKLQAGNQGKDIPEADCDYYLMSLTSYFGNLFFLQSRKERVADAGFGKTGTGLAVV